MSEEKLPVRSVAQAFTILRFLGSEKRGMTLSAVAQALSLNPSSALNLLRALVLEGAVLRDDRARTYRLAADWIAAGLPRDGQTRFIEQARPAMETLAQEQDAAIGLWRLVGGERLQLEVLTESGAATRIHMVVGQRQPFGGGATGRALAASEGLLPDQLKDRYRAVRWARSLSFDDYAQQVSEAGARGYAVDDGFGHAGVCSIGVALPSRADGPRFCLSASVFAGSRNSPEVAALGAALARLGATLGD
jgi:IclR family transcriptional regulator, acetate operon repressor